jgi:hypothetical protein
MRLQNLACTALLLGCAKTTPTVPSGTADGTDTPSATLPFTEADLDGTWESGCVDPGTGQGFTLVFDLTTSTWDLDYAVHADAACAEPFMTVHIEGPYELGDASAAVEGAREGTFGFVAKRVTPHSEAAAGYLASPEVCGAEGFVVGEAFDLTDGCAGLGQYPLADCGSDYDLVAVDADGLRFGARPDDNDMCSPAAQPTDLSPLFLQPRP